MIAEGTVFLDTNIFVYAFLANEPRKRAKAIELIEACLGSGRGCISYQVVQEFANVARKKFAATLSASDCKAFIDAAMQPLNRVASSTRQIHTALGRKQRHAKRQRQQIDAGKLAVLSPAGGPRQPARQHRHA